jgi:hypothetical protein
MPFVCCGASCGSDERPLALQGMPTHAVNTVSYAQDKNERAYMEDKAFGINLPALGDRSALFGVLDGHGGDSVAIAVRREFATCFTDTVALPAVDVPFQEKGTRWEEGQQQAFF